jgi:hypothetical protein
MKILRKAAMVEKEQVAHVRAGEKLNQNIHFCQNSEMI